MKKVETTRTPHEEKWQPHDEQGESHDSLQALHQKEKESSHEPHHRLSMKGLSLGRLTDFGGRIFSMGEDDEHFVYEPEHSVYNPECDRGEDD